MRSISSVSGDLIFSFQFIVCDKSVIQRGVETPWVLVLKCGYIVFNMAEGGDKTEGNIRVLNFSTFRENSLLFLSIRAYIFHRKHF